MCRKVRCQACHKSSWEGCGNHVKSVLRGVPENDWCTCPSKEVAAKMNKPDSLMDWFTPQTILVMLIALLFFANLQGLL